MALSASVKRRHEVDGPGSKLDSRPAVGGDIFYEGAFLGDNGSGFVRPLTAGDPFAGMNVELLDTAGLSDGDTDARIMTVGHVQLSITNVVDEDDVGETVLAADDGTFTLVVGLNTPIGVITRHVSGALAIVKIEAVPERSL